MKVIRITPETLALIIELLNLSPLEELKTVNNYKVIVINGD